MQFTTHTGEIVTGDRLCRAFETVANFWAENARSVRSEDAYAQHVTEAEKDEYMNCQLEQAERIRTGEEPMGFWLWQRVNAELTGECIPLFSSQKRLETQHDHQHRPRNGRKSQFHCSQLRERNRP